MWDVDTRGNCCPCGVPMRMAVLSRSYFNQSFMLFYAAPAQNLMGRYLLVDGPLHCYLKKLRIKSIRFTPTRMDGYVRVDRAEGHGFVDLSFLIHDQSLSCAASIAWKPIGCPYAWVTSGSN